MLSSKAAKAAQRDLKRLARDRLKAARRALVDGRRAYRRRLAELRRDCRAQRAAARDRAREMRAALIEEHRAQRQKLRDALKEARAVAASCAVEDRRAATEVVRELAERVERAERELRWFSEAARRDIRARPGMTRAEVAEHERDMVAEHEIADPDERALFLKTYAAGKVRSSARRSLAEAWAEWLHDHPGALSELRARQEREALARLEAEERAAWEAERATRRRRSKPRAATVAAAEGADPFDF